ncbi:MAG: hypothetical protein IID45_10845 [Planctomycetes bacterium]|nr:hypothetical protein [Planctomycetota bacterium]
MKYSKREIVQPFEDGTLKKADFRNARKKASVVFTFFSAGLLAIRLLGVPLFIRLKCYQSKEEVMAFRFPHWPFPSRRVLWSLQFQVDFSRQC